MANQINKRLARDIEAEKRAEAERKRREAEAERKRKEAERARQNAAASVKKVAVSSQKKTTNNTTTQKIASPATGRTTTGGGSPRISFEERLRNLRGALTEDQNTRLDEVVDSNARLLEKWRRNAEKAEIQAIKPDYSKGFSSEVKAEHRGDTVDRLSDIVDSYYGMYSGDTRDPQKDAHTARMGAAESLAWSKEAYANGDLGEADYLLNASQQLSKWASNAERAERLIGQYGSVENADAYINGDRDPYRRYLNQNSSYEDVQAHIEKLEANIASTSDLARRAGYQEELDWYKRYALEMFPEAAQAEVERLERRQSALDRKVAQSQGAMDASPIAGTPLTQEQQDATLARFDRDIAEAEAAGLDEWYINVLKRARDEYLADPAPVSYRQNWETAQNVYGWSDENKAALYEARVQVERAQEGQYRRENDAKFTAIANEAALKGWAFDTQAYEAFKQDVLEERNNARYAMSFIDQLDLRDLYTIEEASVYEYLRSEGRYEEATAFENFMQPTVAARRNENVAQAMSEQGTLANAATAIVTNPGKIINSLDIMLQKATNSLSGEYRPIDYETTGLYRVASNASRDEVTSQLAQMGTLNQFLSEMTGGNVDIGAVGELTWGDIAGVGFDLANSAVNTAMFSGMSGLAMGVEKFADEYADAKERDGTDTQAFRYAGASAIAEGVGESITISRFFEHLGMLGKTPTLKNILAAGTIFATEGALQEGVTTKLEQTVDRWIMGENSIFRTRVREIREQGYEPSVAEDMANEEMSDEVIKSALLGFVSQGSAVTIGAAPRIGEDNRIVGRAILENDNTAQMAALISEVTGKETAAAKRAGQAGRQYGKFVKKADSYVAKADDATRNIVERKVERVKAAPFVALQGTSEAARQKAEERLSGMQKSDAGASYGGESVKVNGITKVGDKAEVTVTKADGSAVQAPASEVTFSSADAEVYAYAADMATPELANRFRMTVKPEQLRNLDRVANAYSQAYDMAKAGFREESVAASYLVKGVLTGEQVSEVFKLGADTRKSEQVKAVTVAAERAKASMGNAWKGGTVSFDDSVDVGSLTEAQRTQVDMASVITGSMGVNVVFFESQADAKGRYTAENGRYDRRTNTIYLDVNAGRNSRSDSMSQTALLRTLSHEITHAIQRNSPEIYGEIRDMVVEVLGGAQGITIEDLIDAKMARDSSLKTRDAALDEVVADACETMLRDSDAMRLLQEAHPEAAKTFGETLKELAGRIIEAIKAAFKGRRLSTEAQLLMQDAERYREIADKWARGVVETAEVSGRENGSAADEATETEDMADEKAAISEDTAAEGEDITSEDAEVNFSTRESFAEQIDSLLSGEFPREDHLYVMQTPDVLIQVGLKKLPMLMTQKHAKSIMKVSGRDRGTNYQGLTKSGIKQLPRRLSEPAMIIQAKGYENRVIVMTDMINGAGETIIAPIMLDGKGYWQKVEIEANILTTAYGKGNIKSMIVDAIMDDRVLYTDKKRSDTLSQIVGVQFPKDLRSGGFIHSIRRTEQNVNPDSQKQARDPEQVSDRELLVTALQEEVANAEEASWLAAYKEQIGFLEETQRDYDEQRKIINKLNKKVREAQEDARQRSIQFGAEAGFTRSELARLTKAEHTIEQLGKVERPDLREQAILERARQNYAELRGKAEEMLGKEGFEEWRKVKRVAEGVDEAAALSKDEAEDLQTARNRAKILSDRMAKKDADLLEMEGSKPIRQIVERERKRARSDADRRIKKVRDNYETRALRQKLKRKAATLDERLRHPKDGAYIPDGLREAARHLDAVINDLEVGYEVPAERRKERRLDRISRELRAISKENTNLAQEVDATLLDELDELDKNLSERQRARQEKEEQTGKKPRTKLFTALTRDELKTLERAVDHMLYLSGNAYDVKLEGEKLRLEAAAIKEQKRIEGMHAKAREGIRKLLKQFWIDETTPIYFFGNMGGAFQSAAQALFDGESDYGIQAARAAEEVQDIKRRRHYDSWFRDGVLELHARKGGVLLLNREEALMLYATHKREQTNIRQDAQHLAVGGVVERHTDPRRIFRKAENSEHGVKLNDDDMAEIEAWLTDEQKQYADEIVGYMSGQLSDMLNEASITMHGYSKFLEEYYFPYRVNAAHLPQSVGDVEARLIRSMGMAHSTTANASKPVELGEFTDIATEHIQMALLYATVAPAQNDFMRLLNYKYEDGDTMTVKLKDAFGAEAVSYIKDFMRDIYGGKLHKGALDKLADKTTGLMKRNAVALSASVVLQQYWSLQRAMAVIGPQHFYGKLHNPSASWHEAQKYAGTVVLKDIGRFDTNVGRNVSEWIADRKEYTKGRRAAELTDKYLIGWLPEKADMLAWARLWNACKREQARKTGLDINSEELKRIAGRRMDEVVRRTQVYDSVFSKSAHMRNKNWIAKTLTNFMAEPTIIANMTIDAWRNIKKDPAQWARTMGALTVSTVLTNAFAALAYAWRDKDEDETYWEKWVQALVSGTVGDLNFMGYIPGLNDVMSIFQGYSTGRNDLAFVSDAFGYFTSAVRDDRNMTVNERLINAALGIGALTGQPVKNVYRDISGIARAVRNTGKVKLREGAILNAAKWGAAEGSVLAQMLGIEDSKSRSTDQLFEALVNGDLAGAKEIRKHLIEYNGAKDDEAVDSLLRTRIREGYEGGEIDAEEALDMLVEHTGYSPREAAEQLDKWRYDVETGSEYSKLKDDFISGELTAAEALDARTEYGGANEVEARRTINHWQYEKDTGRVFSDMKADYLNDKITRKQAVEYRMKYGGAFESEAEAEVLTWDYEKDTGRSWDDMKYDYMSKEISAKQAIQYRVKYGGKDEYDAEGDVLKWDFEIDYGYPYDDMKEYFKLGKISKEKAIAARVKYGRSEEDDAYFAVTGWEYEKATGKEWQGKFTKLHEGIEAENESAMRSAITEIYEKSAYEDESKAVSAVTSNITSTYKPLYIAASEAERAEMEPILLDAYRLAYELAGKKYYGDSHRLNLIHKWLEDEEDE